MRIDISGSSLNISKDRGEYYRVNLNNVSLKLTLEEYQVLCDLVVKIRGTDVWLEDLIKGLVEAGLLSRGVE